MITRIAVRYPTLTIIAALLVVFWGSTYFALMSKREDPEITIRGAQLITIWPGALPEDVEQYVTDPLEEVASGIAEVSKINSTSRESVSIIWLNLDERLATRDIPQVWDRLRARIDAMQDALPAGCGKPDVNDSFFDTASHVICVSGEHYGPRELTAFAERIKERLALLPAVGRIELQGVQEERIYLEYNPVWMSKYSVDPMSIAAVLSGQNALLPGGAIDLQGDRYSITATGRFTNIEDILNTQLDGVPGVSGLRLRNLGTAHYGYEDPPLQLARVNGEQCVSLSIVMKDKRNVIELGKQVEAELVKIRAELPSGVKLTVVQDQPRQVRTRVHTFVSNLVSGLILVVVVVFLFMGVRATIPVAVAIPLTIIGTFACMSFYGTDMQQISIAALIISLGMLVDNAIVITDSITHHIQAGLSPREAATKATRELVLPVFTSTLTTVFAFVPLLGMSGESGEFVRDIPIVVSTALLVSFLVAITVTPMLGSRLLTGTSKDNWGSMLTPVMEALQRFYQPLVIWTQRHKAAAIAIVTGAMLSAFLLFPQLGVQFFPGANRDQFVIDLYAPEGTSVEKTSELTGYIEALLAEQDEIENYAIYIGQGGPRFYYNVIPETRLGNYAQVLVNTASPKATELLVNNLRQEVGSRVPGARTTVKFLEQGPPVGAPIQIAISGAELDALKQAGSQVEDILASTAGVISISNSFGRDSKQLKLNLNEEQLRVVGGTSANIIQSTQMAYSGMQITSFRAPQREIPVVIRMAPEFRNSARYLEGLYIENATTHSPVPLSSIATMETVQVTSQIDRRDQVRELVVSAYLDEGILASDVMNRIRGSINEINLPPGYRLVYRGEAEESAEAFSGLAAASVVAVLLILLVLVAQFKSIRIALVVFLSIPFSFIGAVYGLYLTGWPFGFIAGLGMISLAGIAVNNAIVLVEFIIERLREGLPPEQAIIEAVKLRLRPILLTTLTTIGGLLPLGINGGDLFAPMAFAIIGGLIASTFLTVIVVPMVFSIVAGRRALQLVDAERRE